MTVARKISGKAVFFAWFILLLVLLIVLLFPSAQVWSLLFLPILIATHKLETGRYTPLTPVDLPIVVMLIMIVGAVFATFDLAFSSQKIVNLLIGIAIFYAVTSFGSQSSLYLLAGSSIQVMMGMGIGVVALFSTSWTSKIPILENIVGYLPKNWMTLPGAAGGINPNELSGVLLWSLPLSLALSYILIYRARDLNSLLNARVLRLFRIVAFLGTLLLLLLLLLAQSRSAFIGIFVSFIFMVLVAVTRTRSRRVKILISTFMIFLAIGSFILFLMAAPSGGELGNSDNDFGLSFEEARQEIWSRAVYGIKDFPITGMGLGTFRRVVPVLYPFFRISPSTDIGHAHNHFLQTALDLGLVGLVGYVGLWIGAGVALWQMWEKSSSFLRFIVLGLSGCLIAYFIYGITDAVALGARPGFLFWSLFGLVMAAYKIISKTNGSVSPI